MTLPGGQGEFDRYRAVLDEVSGFSGFVLWKQVAADWVRENLDNCTPRAIELVLCRERDKIEQRNETRPEWRHQYKYWYRLVTTIDGTSVFIESVFLPASGNKPDMIWVVSVHEAN